MESVSGICVDSDILIDYLRGQVLARDFLIDKFQTSGLYVSSISVAEIYSGQEAGDDAKQDELSGFLDNFFLIPITPQIAKLGGDIRRESNKPFADALIAASAIVYGLALATRNKKHFENIKDLKILTPY